MRFLRLRHLYYWAIVVRSGRQASRRVSMRQPEGCATKSKHELVELFEGSLWKSAENRFHSYSFPSLGAAGRPSVFHWYTHKLSCSERCLEIVVVRDALSP